MPAIATGWELKVDRGPGWLLVKAKGPGPDAPETTVLADQLWSILERHLVYRLVLDLDQIELLNSALIGQLLVLYRRIHEHDGMLRLCGLSPFNQKVLRVHGLIDRFGAYANPQDAVMGSRCDKPR